MLETINENNNGIPLRIATTLDFLSVARQSTGLRIGRTIYQTSPDDPNLLLKKKIKQVDFKSTWADLILYQKVFVKQLWEELNTNFEPLRIFWAFSSELKEDLMDHPVDRLDPWGRIVSPNAVIAPTITEGICPLVYCFVEPPVHQGMRALLIFANDLKLESKPDAVQTREYIAERLLSKSINTENTAKVKVKIV